MGGQAQPSRVVGELSTALGILAGPAEHQRDWLARYLRDGRARTDADFAVDELALQFEDAAQAAPRFVEDGLLSLVQERAVAAVEAQLSTMRDASRAHLWRSAALHGDPEWAEVRRLARQALGALQGPQV